MTVAILLIFFWLKIYSCVHWNWMSYCVDGTAMGLMGACWWNGNWFGCGTQKHDGFQLVERGCNNCQCCGERLFEYFFVLSIHEDFIFFSWLTLKIYDNFSLDRAKRSICQPLVPFKLKKQMQLLSVLNLFTSVELIRLRPSRHLLVNQSIPLIAIHIVLSVNFHFNEIKSFCVETFSEWRRFAIRIL